MIVPRSFLKGFCALPFLVALASCEKKTDLISFRTSAPGLNYLSSYTGRLAERDGCVVLVLGERMLSQEDLVRDEDEVAIPLFNRGLTVEQRDDGYAVLTDDNRSILVGTIVTGEGGPYPTKPLDPRSAPVKDAPDTSACRGTPYQINSMFVSELKRTGQD